VKSKPISKGFSVEIPRYFATLYQAWGPQHWWPAASQFEMIVGAILTQNAAWTNVEKALTNLRQAGVLTLEGIRRLPAPDLELMLRPAGYFRQKAARLKHLIEWLDGKHGGSLERMFALETDELRRQLLDLNGIGPETADSILLYGGQHEVFVVDAYTRRIFERHRLVRPSAKYDDIRLAVEQALQACTGASGSTRTRPGTDPRVFTPVVHKPSAMSDAPRSDVAEAFNQFHALLVQVAKHFCLSREAHCERCPLRPYLTAGKPLLRIRTHRAL